MAKRILVLALVTIFAVAMAAQTQNSSTTKKATVKTAAAQTASKPAAGGPTKVTGPGTTTADGLQYWDIKQGTGAVAQKGDTVKVQYTGWLTNGKKFDSSVGGPPFQFKIGNQDVIAGWDEGVAGMKVGGKRQLKIPPQLAYGQQGAAGVIPPNATLIFDVELVGIKGK